ncbi:response regulator [Roseomonas nepalensis]|uniref:Response regulator n=1 Tax=Muricoccus nepalensis TaxID=1854500 RepID=A0A502EUC8_9PROT|nr:response regulator [Roseomonas nepalensis]TPG40684.1 response regulator [Roseomonas nepalensis]
MPRVGIDQTPHILFAEDDDAVAMVVKDLLTDNGYLVTRAMHGREALSMLSGTSFDLLLTDIRMPYLDGVGLIEEVRQTGSAMPVVVLSGYMTPVARSALDNLGVRPDAVLEKPCGLPALQKAIQNGLRSKRSLGMSNRSSFLELRTTS